jgi:hypothetical protein
MLDNADTIKNGRIICHLIGGLGNQLFQYAAARALAHRLNKRVFLDVSDFDAYPLRKFLLDHFRIPIQFATKKDLAKIRFQRSRLGWLVPETLKIIDQRERGHEFQEITISRANRPIYLSGYWQSEKYFSDIRSIILNEFQLNNEPLGLNKELIDKIKSCEAVSLHVRRGDYVSNPIAAAYHGTCSVEYYQQAIDMMKAKLSSPHFFVFSDDIPWCKENLRISSPITFIDHNGDAPYEDLRLMSHCQHFIVANSSFSWWGAWLSDFSQKIVIAPRRWFLTAEKNDRDQVPGTWLRI